jgi:hypothetical protein
VFSFTALVEIPTCRPRRGHKCLEVVHPLHDHVPAATVSGHADRLPVFALAGDFEDLWSFAAITDEPPQEVAAAGHDRCIIPIKEEHLNA